MDTGKIAGIVAGSVSVVVIGGLLVVKRKYLMSLFSTSPTRTLTAEERAEGYFYTENGDLAKILTEYEEEEERGGKRRKTQRKKKGRK